MCDRTENTTELLTTDTGASARPLVADQFFNLSGALATLMVLPHCQMSGLVV